MPSNLYALAAAGDLEALGRAVAVKVGADEREQSLFQWLEGASSLGHREAGELSSALHQTTLNRGGDETVAVLHFEVAQWFILGVEGVVTDAELGLSQLERAQELGLCDATDVEDSLQALRARLSHVQMKRFDEIFALEIIEPPRPETGIEERQSVRPDIDFDQLNLFDTLGDYVIVRPGISLCLLFDEPVDTLAKKILDILNGYIEFTRPGTLISYLAANGRRKPLTTRSLNSVRKQLASVPAGAECWWWTGA